MQKFEVQQVIDAPVQVVWDRYTDHASWTEWAGLGQVRLVREGAPLRNGVGCVRAISNGPLTVYEEVVSFDPPRRMTYRLVRGPVPMKDHFGEVLFEPNGHGTLVTWRCQFNSAIPGLGGLFRVLIARMFRSTLAKLARLPLAEG